MSNPLPAPSPSKVEKPTVGPTLMPASQPTPAPKNESESRSYQGLREGMAALLSVGILLITLLMLYNTFFQASLVSQANTPSDIAYNHMKDVMLYGLALLGTVTGYYFGRVPAELHAQQAQRSADTAQTDLQDTHANARATSAEANRNIAGANQNTAESLTMARNNAEQLTAAHDKQRQVTRKLVSIQNLLHQASPQSDRVTATHRRSTDAPGTASFVPIREIAATQTPVRQAQEEINALLEQLNS